MKKACGNVNFNAAGTGETWGPRKPKYKTSGTMSPTTRRRSVSPPNENSVDNKIWMEQKMGNIKEESDIFISRRIGDSPLLCNVSHRSTFLGNCLVTFSKRVVPLPITPNVSNFQSRNNDGWFLYFLEFWHSSFTMP